MIAWLKSLQKPVSAEHKPRHGFFLWFLLLSILLSALGVVAFKNSIRDLEKRYHISLEQLYEERNRWGVLMLEKSHLIAPQRVEKIAKEQLQMNYPKEVKVIPVDNVSQAKTLETHP